MIGRIAWALWWRSRAVLCLAWSGTWRERASLLGYVLREAASHVPVLGRHLPSEAWIHLGGHDVRVAIGRYELGGYMDVWLRRSYERDPAFLAQAGWIVVDVGANVGFFALRQAAMGAQVISIEPNPAARTRLAATIQRNGRTGLVTIHGCAAGRSDGTAELAVGAATVTGTLTAGAASGARDAFRVEVRRLDALVPAGLPVDLLKIDTEGAEEDVLAGAPAVLGRTARVVLEWHTPALRAAAAALLAAHGFRRVLAHGSIDYYRRPEPDDAPSARA